MIATTQYMDCIEQDSYLSGHSSLTLRYQTNLTVQHLSFSSSASYHIGRSYFISMLYVNGDGSEKGREEREEKSE